MAIKGKKKSQKRGSQARRRPAAPPRPAVQPRRTGPWYRTPTAIAIMGIIAIIAIGIVVITIQGNREDEEALEKKQNALTEYTDRVRNVLQSLRIPVEAMAAAPATFEEPEQAEDLAKDAEGWSKDLEKIQGEFVGIAPEPAVRAAHSLYLHSITTYITAARAYSIAATTEDPNTSTETLALASAERDYASSLWTEATTVLDEQRNGAELDLSGLNPPGAPAAGTTPTGVPSGLPTDLPTDIPSDLPTDGGGGGTGGNGGGGNGGGGQGGGAGGEGAGSDGQ